MSDARQETVADIMSEMREYADSMEKHDLYDLRECATDYLRVLSDRIEEAVNRQFREVTKMIPHEEVDVSKMETTTSTSEKSSAVGNAAAMREALVRVKRLFDGRLMWQPDIRKAHDAVNAALAAPPRNCDVGTAEEQYERFVRWCASRNMKDCWGVSCGVSCRKCLIAWLQMPYDEGGAK